MLVKIVIEEIKYNIDYALTNKLDCIDTLLLFGVAFLLIMSLIPICVIDIILSPLEIITYLVCKNR